MASRQCKLEQDALTIGEATLTGRARRSCLPTEGYRKGAHSKKTKVQRTEQVFLSCLYGFIEETPTYEVTQLQVMMQDGTMRPARDIFEWFQQFAIEQCAIIIALEQELPQILTQYSSIPCQVPRADGINVPQHCMGCAAWWTEHDGIFAELIRVRRGAERDVRLAAVLFQKLVFAQAHELALLVEPFLKPSPVASSFPCARDEVGSFMTRANYNTFWCRGEFSEGDSEGGLYCAYIISSKVKDSWDVYEVLMGCTK